MPDNVPCVGPDTTVYVSVSPSTSVASNVTATGVAVGSRHGQTTVAAHDLTLRGGNATNASAQLGYRAHSLGAGQTVTGALRVDLKNDLLAQSGGGSG